MSTRRWVGWLALAALLVGGAIWVGVRFAPSGDAPKLAAETPQRIASLTLGTDEILAELVPPERIVCVTSLADDPEISNVAGFYPKSIPRLHDTDPERIIGLHPQLVCVAPYNSADFLKVMERSGLALYRNEAVDSFDQIEQGILELGQRVGEGKRAKILVDKMQARRTKLANQLREATNKPRVLFWSAGFTAGRQTTIDDMIREAGGINVAAEMNLKGSADISPEQILGAEPQFVLVSRWSVDERENQIEKHPLLRNLRAVQEKRVIAIDAKYLTAVSQYVLDGAERLAQQLHPDRVGKEKSLSSPPLSQRQP